MTLSATIIIAAIAVAWIDRIEQRHERAERLEARRVWRVYQHTTRTR
jgi:hypothetical protein